MANGINHKDQRALAREITERLINRLYWTNGEVAELLGNDELAKALSGGWKVELYERLVIDEDEKAKFSAAGFSDEFIDELAGDDGKNILRRRIERIAPLCVPSTLLFSGRLGYPYGVIEELKGYGRDAKYAVTYLLRATDDEDEAMRYLALSALASIGAPASVFKEMADLCAVTPEDGVNSVTNVRQSECEKELAAMLGSSDARPEDVFSAVEYYFNKKKEQFPPDRPEYFADVLAGYGDKAVPPMLKFLASDHLGKKYLALMVLNRLNYRSSKLDPLLAELYFKSNPNGHILLYEISALAARLFLINGYDHYALILAEKLIANASVYSPVYICQGEDGDPIWCKGDPFRVIGADIFDKLAELIKGTEASADWLWYIARQIGPSAGQIKEKLVKYAGDEDETISLFALKCLEHGGEAVVPTFNDVLAIALDGEKSMNVRRQAIQTLGSFISISNDANMVTMFSTLLGDSNIEIVTAAINELNLRIMGAKNVFDLRKKLDVDVTVALLPSFERIMIEGRVSPEVIETVSKMKIQIEEAFL